MTRGRFHLLTIAALLIAGRLACGQLAAQLPQAPKGIAFLHLKVRANEAELVAFDVTPGRLKDGPRHAGARLLLEVQSQSGAPLWQGTVDDPRIQVIEGSAPGGRHSHKVIERSAPELMVRVPFFEEGQLVRVSRVTPAVAAAAHEKLLGTFRLAK
jgi:hypothetical protein